MLPGYSLPFPGAPHYDNCKSDINHDYVAALVAGMAGSGTVWIVTCKNSNYPRYTTLCPVSSLPAGHTPPL